MKNNFKFNLEDQMRGAVIPNKNNNNLTDSQIGWMIFKFEIDHSYSKDSFLHWCKNKVGSWINENQFNFLSNLEVL